MSNFSDARYPTEEANKLGEGGVPHSAHKQKPPAVRPGALYPTLIRRSWPEVALQTQDRRPDVLARREVDARRTAARTREVQRDQIRVMLGLNPRVHDFEADIE